MATSKVRAIIEAVKLARGGSKWGSVYNDKTAAGRSIKVGGWEQADYNAAQTALEAAGYTVKQVTTAKIDYVQRVDVKQCDSEGGNIRLHVTE